MIEKKVILFDLGGVLIESINPKHLYNALNSKIDFKEFFNYWNNDKSVYDAHQGLISDVEHIQKLLKFSNSDKDVNEFLQIYENLDKKIYKRNYELVNIVKDKGYKIGILSNLREMDYNRVKKVIDVSIFDYIFLSYEMKELKPNKSIYTKVIEKCKVNAENIYFFDDNINNVQGAIKCGINGIKSKGLELERKLIENNII